MARGIKPGLPTLACLYCEGQFTAKTSWQKFCSRKCEQSHIGKKYKWRKSESYKKWLANKLKEDPDFFRKRYLKRRLNEPNYQEKCRIHAREFARKSRTKVLEHYGNQCRCCGETKKEFLCLDHINGGGSKHRRELRGKSSSIYRWIIRNNYPKEFRVLCHNCNQSRGYYGYCPHEKL